MSEFPLPSTLSTLRTVVGVDPAANTEWSFTVPPDRSYILLGASVSLAQGITQTPQPSLVIDDGTNILEQCLGASAAQNVSVTARYSWAPGLPLSAGGAATLNTAPMPSRQLLLPGYRVRSATSGIGANSDYAAPTLFVCDLGQWSPTQINGLTAWYDAADGRTLFTDTGATTLVAADGDAVAAWTDKSGQGNTMTQSTAGSRPLYKVNVVGRQSSVRFDNTDDFMSRSTFAAGAIAQPTTHFYAANLTTTAIFQEPMDGVTTRQAILNADGTKWGQYAGSVAAGTVAVATGSALVVAAVFNGASSTLYVNGGAHQTLSPGSNTMNGVRIGRGTDGVNLNGDFYEGLVYAGALTSSQLDTVGRYLANKWGSTWTAVS